MRYLFAFLFGLTVTVAFSQSKIKVACIGASITYGSQIPDRAHNSYPAQLQKMLGNKYVVTNYGLSATTMLHKGDKPYFNTKQYQDALADTPNVVIIDLGGNDAKAINRGHLDEFEHDQKEMVEAFKQLSSHPRIVLLSAMASFVKDTAGIWDPVIVKRINPMIQNVAYAEGVEVIDMHAPFVNKEANFSDKLHPDKEGAGIMALNIYRLLAQKRDAGYDIFTKLPDITKKSSFYGYECADLTFTGRPCKIVKPKMAAPGHPWMWRARFWGHEPQTDIALLQQGFHIVYCDVVELLGNSEAISDWNNFYSLLQKAGLNKKAVMIGMSRGGMYVFNWAAENPNKVAAVYVDNPLLNMNSWNANFIGKENVKDQIFTSFKKDYGLNTDQEIMAFKGSPVDKVKQIVKGKYPILVLLADADEVVNPTENTLLFEQRVKQEGSDITVIHKPGFKHHPHSLPNPAPSVDFILKATGYEVPVTNAN